MTAAYALVLLLQLPAPAGSGTFDERLACAPMSLAAPPTPALKIAGGYVAGRMMFGPGEAVVIGGGTAKGLQPGQQYFVRRYIKDRFTPASPAFTPHSIHTTGWVRIVEVNDTSAIATIVHACDAVFEGDYLEPFSAPALPQTSQATARPDYANPAHIVMADERRQMGYPGLLMLLDRGSDQGVQAGQGLTIFRATRGQGPAQTIASATVLSVSPQVSIVRIDTIADAVFVGDLAAIHRITQ